MNSPKLESLLGGREFRVKLIDGSTETVQIRQLPVRDFERYLAKLDDECGVAEMLCLKEAGWADRIHPTSLGELVTAGEEVNADFFVPWLRRRADRAKRIASGVAPEPAKTSPTTLPASPSVAG
jgi:hypothetical protein